MALAISILHGDSYDKHNVMETSLVTSENASILLLQYREIVKQDEYINRMHNRVDLILTELGMERVIMWGIAILAFVITALLVVTVRALHTRRRLNEALKKKNEELSLQKETAERQRDELEEQRDKLLDVTTKPQTDDDNATMQNEFLTRFYRCLDESIADSELSVEDVGRKLGFSRVQLYRKVKAITGKTPVEIIREERLKRANVLLNDISLSVSEVAYRVGFSSPSYFTKCYKDFYGKSPS